MATPLPNVRVLPLTVDSHPSLLGSSSDVLGGAASPPLLPLGLILQCLLPPPRLWRLRCLCQLLSQLLSVLHIFPSIDSCLPPIKSGSDYLQTWDLTLFWLRSPSFSTGRLDSSLITDTSNSLASQYWEGQPWMAVQDSPVWFLFGNTGDLYLGHEFEMLATL